jgi:hypothetical protein
MTETKIAYATLRFVALVAALLFFAALQTGCGATCDRIEKDRVSFLARKGKNTDTHVEVLVPFTVAERLVEPYVSAVNPIDVNIPGLGKLESYFGDLSVAPVRVKLKPAAPDHIGFHLDFEVRTNGKRAFEMYLETEVRPGIDLAGGEVSFGFTPEALQKARPGMSKDAKNDLGDVIYSRIPSVAKILISRSMVQAAAGTTVDMLMSGFYEKAKNKMLPKLSKMSRFDLAIPDVPLASVAVTSTDDNGGRVRLAIVTSLPVSNGLAEAEKGPAKPSKKSITIRMSGSTVAELVNWAMSKGLTPDRYDGKGKPKKDGELRPGLDWVADDERPMKVMLWDLTKPCMRLTMSAKPSVKVADESLEINAGDIKTDDVEASAFTKVGVWFNLLWKDALKLQKKTSTKTKVTVAGKEIDIVVAKASVENDELKLLVNLAVKGE